MIPHNAMSATAYQQRPPLAGSTLAPWSADLAWNACAQHGAEEGYHAAMQAIRESLLTGRPLRNASAIDCVFGLAYDDAQLKSWPTTAPGSAKYSSLCSPRA